MPGNRKTAARVVGMHLGLIEAEVDPDAIVQFGHWFEEAQRADLVEPTAMTLATASRDGAPSARMVLLKGFDERGFIFFTNYESRKGQELAQNPQAALVFYWAELERQVCIAGSVSKLRPDESQAYFQNRPRGSRLAAWASQQSQVVRDRLALEEKWKEVEAQYPSREIPMPPYWGGYVLSPTRLEFWQGRPNRPLPRWHDRERLAPELRGAEEFGNVRPAFLWSHHRPQAP